MTDTVHYEVNDGIALLRVDNPPVNAMNQAMRIGLRDGIRAAAADAKVRAVLILAAGRTFIAGADLKEFDTGVNEPDHNLIFAELEDCPKPVVAAMHGTALGAGVELALACHYRCAVPGAKLGLPELTLGIIPGAGGTQRLPRLIGARRALKFILDARPVGADDALALGIVDKVLDGDLEASALTWVRELLEQKASPRPTSRMAVDTDGFDEAFLDECRKQAARFMRGQQAPERLIEAIRAGIDLGFDAGLRREREIGDAALASEESRALRHVFFAEREVSRIPGLDAGTERREIGSVGIIGAGTMGGGIAMNFANVGIPVTIIDASPDALERGLAVVRKNYEVSVKRGRLSADDLEKRMGLITPAQDYGALADVDLVIEAVFEDMRLKKQIFRELERVCRPDAILATNTSTLNINDIAAAISRPEQVIGLHFFSPANVMRLLEIVRAEKTSARTLASCVDVAKRIRKVGVVVGVCYGFVGNRMMLQGYFREADQMLIEGATPEQVDRVMYDFGFAMGPFAVSDMAGLDVGYKARLAVNAARHYPEPYHTVADSLAARGWLGQKTGSGFYCYEAGDRTPKHNPEVAVVIEGHAERLGIERREISDEEVLVRCVYPLVNEGARILEEGIAYRAGDIDVIWTSGYGFPRYRGGPMFYGDTVGLREVCAAVTDYHERLGEYWKPAPLLERLAADGGSFGDWRPE